MNTSSNSANNSSTLVSEYPYTSIPNSPKSVPLSVFETASDLKEWRCIQYNRFLEHPEENTIRAIALAEEERDRRIADADSERKRKAVAKQVSELVEAGLRQSWFQQGHAYVLALIKLARKAGDSILWTASHAKLHVQELSEKSINAAISFGLSVQSKGNKVPQLTSSLDAQGVKKIAIETVQEVKAKIQLAAQKGAASAKYAGQQIQVAGQDIAKKAKRVSRDFQTGVQKIAVKVRQSSRLSREIAKKIIDKSAQAWFNAVYNANMAYIVQQEEKERQWRMTSETEVYAIYNAMKVSDMIKELSPALYGPDSEPSRYYFTRLLENLEQARRVQQSKSDKTTITGVARTTSKLVLSKEEVAPSSDPMDIFEPRPVEETKIQYKKKEVIPVEEKKVIPTEEKKVETISTEAPNNTRMFAAM